jgi:hypothetical protein
MPDLDALLASDGAANLLIGAPLIAIYLSAFLARLLFPEDASPKRRSWRTLSSGSA